ncbi:MAG: trigger factor [Cellulosilyticaceae bacterium]
MNTQVEILEKSQVKLTVEVGAKEVSEAIAKAYTAMKKDFNMPGFRKGKVPRAMVEKMYGVEVFFNKAADILIDETLYTAMEENNIQIAARIRQGELNVDEMTKEGMKYTAIVAVKPEVTLGEYKGVKIEVEKPEVTEEEVTAALTQEAEKNSREITVADRAVEPQDKVTIDFEGFVDGEAFEGGKGEDYDLVIGSKSFIDNFEDQLIGKNIGEEVEVNVTFPAEYQSKELAGKPAMFKVTVKAITVKELPEINDDFAADVSEFETLNEYKESIKAKLQEQKETAYQDEIENKAIEAAVANSTIELADAMVEEQADRNVKEFGMRMRHQGLELEQYLQFTGSTMETFRENFKADAENQLRSRLVLEKVAEVENIEVSDEEFQEELKTLAARYNMELDKLQASLGENEKIMLGSDLKVQKAAKMITDSAVVTQK